VLANVKRGALADLRKTTTKSLIGILRGGPCGAPKVAQKSVRFSSVTLSMTWLGADFHYPHGILADGVKYGDFRPIRDVAKWQPRQLSGHCRRRNFVEMHEFNVAVVVFD
jgi:hypothetical protein